MHTKQKAFSYILFPLFSAGDDIPAFSFCINRQKFLFSQKQRAAKECLELFDGTLFSSSCQGDLNPRPPPYQATRYRLRHSSLCDKHNTNIIHQLGKLCQYFLYNFDKLHLLFHLHESTMPNRIKHCFIKFIFFLSQFIFQQFLCLALNPLQSIIHRLRAFSEKLCDFPVIRSHQVQFQHMILQRT